MKIKKRTETNGKRAPESPTLVAVVEKLTRMNRSRRYLRSTDDGSYHIRFCFSKKSDFFCGARAKMTRMLEGNRAVRYRETYMKN